MKSKYPVTQISSGAGPAVHSYFDLCPESFDATRVLYYEFTEDSARNGYVMVATLNKSAKLPLRHDPTGEPCSGSSHEGVEQQWVDNNTIAYRGGERDHRETVICSIHDNSIRRLPGAIRMFSPVNGMGLNTSGTSRNDEPAVYLMDFQSGKTRRLFTRKDLFERHPWHDSIKDLDKIYFKHSKWTLDGKRFFVVFTNEGYDRPAGVRGVKSIFVADAGCSNIRYLCEFGHHPMWADDGTFAYAFDFRQDKMLNLVAHPIDGREAYPLLSNIHGWHASLNPEGTKVVTDVGAWKEKGNGALLLYDLKTGEYTELVIYKMVDASHAGCHAHPVWSRNGKRVYFNSSDTGVPQLYAIDLV
ncbi:MAG: hypothetical protein Q7N50_00125 [Armatimonadota bacterium]|nr:hypothetical protein [Armatimonadota bacterium]